MCSFKQKLSEIINCSSENKHFRNKKYKKLKKKNKKQNKKIQISLQQLSSNRENLYLVKLEYFVNWPGNEKN